MRTGNADWCCRVAAGLLVLTAARSLQPCHGQASMPAGESAAAGKRSTFRIHPEYLHYFQGPDGRPVILIGDYTWATFSEVDFDYRAQFDSIRDRGLNVCRVWLWWGTERFPERHDYLSKLNIEPYLRPGPGTANDGRPRYDLTRFNEAFFDRVRDLCAAARDRGVVLQLITVDAWMLKHAYLWKFHAYQRDNNINGVDGDPANTGAGIDGRRGFCSMENPKVMEFQKAYIRRLVDAVNEFDNIYLEIANENYYSREWELHLCDEIKAYEKGRPRQHITMPRDLLSHSDVVQKWDPAVVHDALMAKRKLNQPLIFDTDWIINPNDDEVRKAMWAAVLSGGHFNYMDDSLDFGVPRQEDRRPHLHRQIDHLAAFVKHIRPWEMPPDNGLVRSGRAFAMASTTELAAYLPSGGNVTLDLAKLAGELRGRWYDPRNGAFREEFSIRGGGRAELTAPDGQDWALLIRRAAGKQ